MTPLLLVCCWCVTPVSAAEPTAEIDPKRLSTAPALQVGQYFVYSYTKSSVQTGRPQEVGTTDIRIEVVDADEDDWYLSWHQSVPAPDGDDQSLLARLSRAGDMTLQLRVDRDFDQVELVNFQEIHPRLIQIAELTFELVGGSTPPEQREQVRGAMVSMFENPDFALAAVMNPVDLFFLPAGWHEIAGRARVGDVELQSPFGGAPLPATLTVVLEEVEDEPGVVRLEYLQAFEPGRVDGMVKDLMQSFAAQFGLEHLEEDAPFSIDVRDRAVADFEVERGVFRRIEFRRSSALELPGQPKGERLETWTWLLTAAGNKEDLPDEP
ncbi:MAG: hypothetical protein LAT64_01375 [Phycisphaerales bacterium]|nr:hypothetical protein [Planctomycetota bacterium]MCH8507412.1 hypothetical protein [Phycisphaerales bacterium]